MGPLFAVLSLLAAPDAGAGLPDLSMDGVQITLAAPLAAYVPTLARIHGVKGEAALRCRVTDDGHLADCAKVREDPVGMGYLDSVRRMAKGATIGAVAKDGSKTAGRTLLFETSFKFCSRAACIRDASERMLAVGREP